MKKNIRIALCSLVMGLLFMVSAYGATMRIQQGEQTVITVPASMTDNTSVNLALDHNIQGNQIIVRGNRPGNHTMTITGSHRDAYGNDVFDSHVIIITVVPTEANISMLSPTTYTNMAVDVVSYVDVRLRNTTSGILASAVNISIPANPNFHVQIVDNPSPFTLANAERTIRLRITPREGASGAMSVPFELNFRNAINETFTEVFEIPVLVQETPDATLAISDVNIPSNIPAGTPFTVSATIRNTSSTAANNVQASLSGLSDGLLMQGSNVQFVGNLPAGAERVVSFNMSSTASTATGSHPITLNVTDGDGIDLSPRAYVTIIGGDEDEETGRITVVSLTRPTGVFAPNQQVNIELVLRNDGDDTINHLSVIADTTAGVVPRLASSQSFQNLSVGQTATFNFAFAGTAAARTQFHDIGFAIEYGEREFTQFSGFAINNPELDAEDDDDERNIITPRVIISNYRVDPVIVMANSEFDLYLTIQNTDANRSIGNMRVTWQVHGVTTGTQGQVAGGATFTPVNASNTFFIEHIGPRGEVVHPMRLFTIPDAAAQNHVITIEFDYYDMDGNNFITSEEIGVNVRQVSRLEMDPAMVPEHASVGELMMQQFSVFNTGRSTLHNLRVWFEGEGFNTSDATEFFGPVEGGDARFFFGAFSPYMDGMLTVYRVSSFEDDLGEIHEVREPFEVFVTDPWGGGGFDGGFDVGGWDDFPMGDFDMGWDDGSQGLDLDTTTWIAIGGGVVAVGVIAFVIIRKKRRGPSFLQDDGMIGFAQMAATKEAKDAAPTEPKSKDKE